MLGNELQDEVLAPFVSTPLLEALHHHRFSREGSLCWKDDDFVLKMMDFVLKMDFILK